MTDVPEIQVPPPTFTIAAEGVNGRILTGPVPMALVTFHGSGAVCNVAIPIESLKDLKSVLSDLQIESRKHETGIVTPERRIVVPNGNKRRG